MGNTEILITVSILCDVILFGLIFWLFAKIRSLSPKRVDMLIRHLKESRVLAKRLEKLVKEKAEIAQRLEGHLKEGALGNNSAYSMKEQVISLREQGLDPKQIAQKTGLSTGEVDFILSVEDVSVG